MRFVSRVLMASLLATSLLGCQETGTPLNAPNAKPASVSLGAKQGATIVISLKLPANFNVKAAAKTLTDVQHYVAQLHDATSGAAIGSAIDLFPLTTGTFTGVPDGSYYVTVDAKDGSNASISDGGAPARSANTVTVASNGTDVRYTGGSTVLEVNLQLQNGTGGDAILSLTAPGYLSGLNVYGLTLVRDNGDVSSRQRGDTSTVTVTGLADGAYKVWAFAADSSDAGSIATPHSITVAGETTTAGRTGSFSFPAAITTDAYAGSTDLRGMATAANGDLYMADTANNQILKRSAVSGTVSVFAGNGSSGDGDKGDAITGSVLKAPTAVAVDGEGNVFVADNGNRHIKMIPAVAGTYFGQAMTVGGIYRLGGNIRADAVAADAQGNVYYNDNKDVQMLVRVGGSYFGAVRTANTEYTLATATANPLGLTVDRWSNIFYTNDTAVTMLVNKADHYFEANPAATRAVGASFNLPDLALTAPRGLATDGAGNVYVSDNQLHKVMMVDRYQGNAYRVAGTGTAAAAVNDGEGGAASAANLKAPFGVGFAPSGRLFVSSQNGAGLNRLRYVN